MDQTRRREATSPLTLAANSIFSFLDTPDSLTKACEA